MQRKPQVSQPSTQVTCSACGLPFSTGEEMRKHYGTEFHLQNVRNRVEGKPALSRGEFRRLFGTEAAMDDDDDAPPSFACKLCQKTFHSVQTLQSHVKSTEHLMRKEQKIINRDSNAGSMLSSTSLGSAALGLHRRHRAHRRIQKQEHVDPSNANNNDASTQEGTEKPKISADDRETDVSETRCLFCGLQHESMEKNLAHLAEKHEFTIPLERRCKDVKGFMQYIAEKVNGCICLVCNDKTKKYDTLQALRAHMKAANHEYVALSSEYDEFYTGSLDDGETAPIVSKVDAETGALVVADGKKAIVFRKRDHTGHVERPKPSHETPAELVERRAIVDAAHKETQLLLKERREAKAKENKKEKNMMGHQAAKFNRQQMKMGIKHNKFHPKGYDGEGEVN